MRMQRISFGESKNYSDLSDSQKLVVNSNLNDDFRSNRKWSIEKIDEVKFNNGEEKIDVKRIKSAIKYQQNQIDAIAKKISLLNIEA